MLEICLRRETTDHNRTAMSVVTSRFVTRERVNREPFHRANVCGERSVVSTGGGEFPWSARTVAKALCIVFAFAKVCACPKPHTWDIKDKMNRSKMHEV